MKIQVGDIVRYNKKTYGYMYDGVHPLSFMIVIEINEPTFKTFMFPSNIIYTCIDYEVVKVKLKRRKINGK